MTFGTSAWIGLSLVLALVSVGPGGIFKLLFCVLVFILGSLTVLGLLILSKEFVTESISAGWRHLWTNPGSLNCCKLPVVEPLDQRYDRCHEMTAFYDFRTRQSDDLCF